MKTQTVSKADIRFYYCDNAVHGKARPAAMLRFEMAEGVVAEGVPCSGKIDPRYILKAFESGSTAVCVLACPIGECKMMEGNLRVSRRVIAVREILAEAGIDPNSVQVFLPDSLEDAALEAALEKVSKFLALSRRQPSEVAA